jgi:adenosylhomocysteine nucleosidase
MDILPRIAVFTPTQAEFAGPFRSLEVADQTEDGTLVIATGRLHGIETVLVRTGMGPENAAAAAICVFETFNVSEVLVAGFGGATQPSLGAGDLVSCSELIDLSELRENPPRIKSSSSLMVRAQWTGLLSVTAPAATVPRVVSTSKLKLSLGEKYGIKVVEMEGFPVLNAARESGVPALMIRAVLDTAEENLPDTTGLLTNAGEPRPKNVITHLVGRPRDAVLFSSLRKRVKTCRRVLDEFLERYLHLLPG